MRDASSAQALLSLFTAPGRAESIAGDLIEECELRGSAWFWFHAFRTTFALFTSALATAPVMTLGLVAMGFAVFAALAFAGVAVVFFFPFIGSGLSWFFLSLFWWSAALCTGVCLVSVAPKHGMTACLTLALAFEALLLSCSLFFTLTEPSKAWFILLYASALFAVVPLLAGGVFARRRNARQYHV